MTNPFPTRAVCDILNITVPSHGDTYVSVQFSYPEALRLVACGALKPDDRQNDAPTTQELLDYFAASKVEFIGYVVFPPRSDARVSIEGFLVTTTDPKVVAALTKRFRKADEFDITNGVVRAWWD